MLRYIHGSKTSPPLRLPCSPIRFLRTSTSLVFFVGRAPLSSSSAQIYSILFAPTKNGPKNNNEGVAKIYALLQAAKKNPRISTSPVSPFFSLPPPYFLSLSLHPTWVVFSFCPPRNSRLQQRKKNLTPTTAKMTNSPLRKKRTIP